MAARAFSYYFINGLTMYRLVSAPFLLAIAVLGWIDLFRWLVAFSFLTDALDGPLARKFKATSVFGARLDSVADDATVFVSTLALWVIHPGFVKTEWVSFAGLAGLFAVQTATALAAYKRVTSFHTYLAKAAAVAQAIFFIAVFFQVGPILTIFCIAVWITALQLLEEILLVPLLPEWKTNVKGLYWVLKSRNGHFDLKHDS